MIYIVHIFHKTQLKKKRQSVGRIWNPDRYKCQNWALYITITHKYSGNVASREECYQKVRGSKNIANLEKSFFVFSEKKISTLRDPERNYCRIFSKPSSFDPHSCQYFYTPPKRYPKIRGSRVIRLYIFSHDNFFLWQEKLDFMWCTH